MPEGVRIILYPEGTDEEIWFSDLNGTTDVPAVGDQLQRIERPEGLPVRSPMYEVTKRTWLATHYSASRVVTECALAVRPVSDE